jgi:hypothetical protein
MKLDKEDRLIGKILSAYSFGMSFAFFIIYNASDIITNLAQRALNSGFFSLILAIFFFGWGWFTEEK